MSCLKHYIERILKILVRGKEGKNGEKKADKNPVDPSLFYSVVLFSSHVEMSLFSTSGSVVQVFITNALAIVGIVNDSSYIQKCSLILVHSFLGLLD